MEKTIASIIENANGLENNFHRRPIKCSFENRDFVTFDTRKETFKEILEALEDPNCRRIGVYGIGGVGKTTLVKEVAQKAQKKGLFSNVVMVTVSQPVDLERIQEKVMEMLNLKVDDKSMEARASRLPHRLDGQGKVLLILDDIWEKVDLEAIGIYSREDGKGSKLLLVSRHQDLLCNDMNVEKDIEVRVLSEEEAMSLFNKYVGRTSDDHKFKDLATKIVGRCGSLPIAIVTIACALKNREIHVWREALRKLKRSPKEGFGEAYSSIKTSYDFLTSNQERMVLLLCSLHEEDANIDVMDLTNIYSAYSDMFLGVTTLEEARDSVRTLVDNLRGCSLLLNGDYDGTIKLHDVVRQIMYSIASEDNNMVCFENFTSLKNDLNQGKLKDTTAISLLGPDFHQLPDDLACPELKLLMHQGRKYSFGSERVLVPKGFLEGAKELRALRLVSVIVQPSSLSPRSLSNLTTLSLKYSVLEDIACIGELEKLVILDLSHSQFRELPEQIGKLTCLHQLNLNWCLDLKVVRPNVISSLKQMEELYMDEVYIKWGMEAEVGDGQNADLAELVELPHLRDLHLFIFDASALPKHKLFDNENLEWYHIVVGQPYLFSSGERSRKLHFNGSRKLHLELIEQSQFYECGFQRLIKEAEELCLKTVPGVENIVNHLDANGFPQLMSLKIDSITRETTNFHASSSVTPFGPLFHGKVAFPSLEDLELEDVDFSELWPNGLPSTSFMKNLTTLSVAYCKNLKYLFPFAIVGSFMQLEHLRIYNCAMMEEIIKESPGRSGKILFPKLRNLTLESLQSLKRFCGGDWSMECESLLKIEITYCPQLQTFNEKVPYFNILSKMIFRDLQVLNIQGCNTMTYLLSFDTAESLKQLVYVEIRSCDVMEHVISKAIGEDGRLKKISFPKLECLDLNDLPLLESFCEGADFIECPSLLELKLHKCEKLRTFIPNLASTTPTLTEDEQQVEVKELVAQQPLFNKKVAFPRLEKLDVTSCQSVKYLLSDEMARSLLQLETLKVYSCKFMEELAVIKEADEEGGLIDISFPKLKCLDLFDLPMLKRFSAHCVKLSCPSLLKLNIDNIFDNGEVPYFGIISDMIFRDLQELEILGLNNGTYLLSFATVESLKQLKRLLVRNCNVMKHVIGKAVGEDRNLKKISFPKLETLTLSSLSKLECFCEGADIIEFSALLKLEIYKCEKLRTFILDSGSTTPTLTEDEQQVEVRETMIEQPLFNAKVAFPRLEKLEVMFCLSLKYLLSDEMAGSLLQLETLKVHSCKLMEELAVIKKPMKRGSLIDISFPRLKYLDLDNLPMFKRFSTDCVKLSCPSLPKLKIKNIFDNGEVRYFGIISDMIFRDLQELEILGLNKRTYLLSFATVESLKLLRKLKVWDCNVMEHVISKAVGEDRNLKKISFPKLEYLELSFLSKLQCFCEGADIIEFSALLKLKIYKCEKLRTFILDSGSTTPTLKEDEQQVEVREMMTEQPLFNAKVVFPRLEKLEVRSCESLKYLLSYEIARNLLQLESLKVNSCQIMEELAVIKEANKEGSLIDISFPKLKYIDLDDLPMLERFLVDWVKFSCPSLLKLKIEISSIKNIFDEREARYFGILSNMTFRDLQELEIFKLNSGTYLLPFATVESLKQLKKLKLWNCNVMEHVISKAVGEDRRLKKISFPKLESLELYFLSKLERFCEVADFIECPSLLKLEIYGCKKLRTFVPSSASTTPMLTEDEQQVEVRELVAQQTLFNEKVAFPRLEKLEVMFCLSLKYLLSDEMAGSLLQLETLKVHSCKLMEELAVIKKPMKRGSLIDISFPRLKYLDLDDLPMLKRFSTDCVKLSCPSLPKLKIKNIFDNGEVQYFGIISDMIFRDLQELEILGLNNGTYLLSFATVESLKLLKKLKVQDCNVMEHVISKAVGEDRNLKKISFPKLESLELSSLSKLKCFCEGADIIEFSALLKLEIYKCEKLRTFILDSESTTPTLTEDEQQVEVRETMTEQPLFNAKVMFPSLEKLEVRSCESLKYLLSCEMVKSLLQLESLNVYSCKIMEKLAVIKEASEEGSLIDISFPKLKYLYLEDLPMLKRFLADSIKWSCPSLLKLKIKNIFDGEEISYLRISPNMIFNDLQELEIFGLNSGAYLLPFAAIESLMQLRKLKLWKCNMMEHVISKAVGEDGRLKKISFPKLESVELSILSKLERFCEGSDHIECPSLLSLKIYKCKQLRTFVLSSTSTTPTFTEDEQQVEVKESVTQQTLFNEKVVFSNLEDLWICYCGEDVNEIWPRQSSTPLFPKLKVLHLMELTNLMHLFDNLENIQSMPQAVQPLETLFVYNCPGLKTLAASSYFSFKNLTDVSISNCHGMTSLLDSSTAKSLEQLTRMSITECDQLKHVIRTNHTLQDESAEGGEIVFRRLKILAFRRLPCLESFHGGNNNILELPSLERLIVSECPGMWTFSHGRVNAPKLNRSIITEVLYWPCLFDVQLWFKDLERVKPVEEVILEGDLNRSIRKLWVDLNDPHIAL